MIFSVGKDAHPTKTDIKKKFGNKYDMEIEQLKDFYRKEGKIK